MVEQCTVCQSPPTHAWRVNTSAINFHVLNDFFLICDWNNNNNNKKKADMLKVISVCFLKQQISPSSV